MASHRQPAQRPIADQVDLQGLCLDGVTDELQGTRERIEQLQALMVLAFRCQADWSDVANAIEALPAFLRVSDHSESGTERRED